MSAVLCAACDHARELHLATPPWNADRKCNRLTGPLATPCACSAFVSLPEPEEATPAGQPADLGALHHEIAEKRYHAQQRVLAAGKSGDNAVWVVAEKWYRDLDELLEMATPKPRPVVDVIEEAIMAGTGSCYATASGIATALEREGYSIMVTGVPEDDAE